MTNKPLIQVIAVLRSHRLLLAILALQFVIVNVVTSPLYGDAPRNLHWGLLTAQNPNFLIGAPDTFERIKGFAPDPPTLSRFHLYEIVQGSLHRWWGPLAPLLFALVWKLTGSYTLLQMVIPLAGAGLILLLYVLARDMLGPQQALVAAAFLACFPIVRQYASTSYIEVLSALVVTAALLCYRRGNLWATILLGGLTVLTKMDLYPLFAGAVCSCAIARLTLPETNRSIASNTPPLVPLVRSRFLARYPQWRYDLAVLLVPLLLTLPWILVHYLGDQGSGPPGGFSAEIFMILAPQLLELLFYIPWYGALITLAAISVGVWAGLRNRKLARADVGMLLGWLGAGLLILLVYAATQGAGNSPRVLIPALPALAILFAAGFDALHMAWRRRIGFYLVVIFMVINLVTIVYDSASGREVHSYLPAWDALRTRPQGYVLTEKYWETMLFAGQPATWFESDPQFEEHIMRNRTNFARYLEQHPIRYVLLPHDGPLASPEVRAYLDSTATRQDVGSIVIYQLP